jgi:hypothetical protein
LQFNSVANINQSGEKRKRVKGGALERMKMELLEEYTAKFNMEFNTVHA